MLSMLITIMLAVLIGWFHCYIEQTEIYVCHYSPSEPGMTKLIVLAGRKDCTIATVVGKQK